MLVTGQTTIVIQKTGDLCSTGRSNQPVSFICSTNGNRVLWIIKGLINEEDDLSQVRSGSSVGFSRTVNGVNITVTEVDQLFVTRVDFVLPNTTNTIECRSSNNAMATMNYSIPSKFK